jgi:amino acid adenylation domain-containing protein
MLSRSFLIHQSFDQSARAFWGKDAIYMGEDSISYGNLYLSSNQLANYLRGLGVKKQDRIVLLLPKSINSLRSILAILKSGGIYVPVDAKAPVERAREVILDCTPSVLMGDSTTLRLIEGLLDSFPWTPKVVVLGHVEGKEPKSCLGWEEQVRQQSQGEPVYLSTDTDIAYILYTSGSTGKPKGVMISHLNILNYISWAVEYFGITPEDNILNTSPLHFDMATFDLYCALLTGASLTLVPEQTLLFPVRLLETIDKRKVTIWKGVSSLLSYLVKTRALAADKLMSLGKIIFSGEPLPTKYLIEWMRTFSGKAFYNAYGPTECTGISTCYRVEKIPSDVEEAIPIGKACANKEIFALTDDGDLARVGEIGELHIKGSSLSCGYWRDPEKTQRAFLVNPLNRDYEERVYRTGDLVKQLENGDYVYVGRRDDQIKYMGYRIEIGEIEFAVRSLSYVRDAAVIAKRKAKGENPEIIAFVEVEKEENLNRICEDLSEKLPRYMIPCKIRAVDQLPRTRNGKVDKQFLRMKEDGHGDQPDLAS